MKKKGIIIGIFVYILLINIVLPVSGTIISKNMKLKEQNITDEQEIPLINGDDIEIEIYAGDKSDNPTGPSFGFQATIEVINNLNEEIWVYYQEDYFSLFTGQPIDVYQWRAKFVVPPHDSYKHHISGGVPIPCRYRITAQAYIIEYESRSGFQFRRFTFFPREK